jgi:hypothetical protein
VKVSQRNKKRSRCIEPKGCSGECLAFLSCCTVPIVGTAEAVAAGHREAFQRISISSQGEDVAGDQGSAKVLTFDLSIPVLTERLILGSQSQYQQVQQDVHWASRCQLSVNDQSLVIKWGSRLKFCIDIQGFMKWSLIVGGSSVPSLRYFAKLGVLNMSELMLKTQKLMDKLNAICVSLNLSLLKCAHEHLGEWHKHVSGVACDLRAAPQETIKMLPTMALFGREAILPIEREIPTQSTLRQPNLDQEETSEQRRERFKTMEHMQSLCKAHIKQVQFVQKMNYST